MSQRRGRYVRVLILASIALAAALPPPASAQTSAPSAPDTVVKSLYEALSFTTRSELDLARIRNVFAPTAQIISTGRPDGATAIRVFNVESFLAFAVPEQTLATRHERELWSRLERFGNVAHVFSAYELVMTSSDGRSVVRRGINSVQLYHDGEAWFITSLVWDIERPGNPMPAP